MIGQVSIPYQQGQVFLNHMIMKDLTLLLVTARGDVIQRACKFESERSGHVRES